MENMEIVTVDARFHAGGSIEPLAIVWDGKPYSIEEISDSRKHVDHKQGRVGVRFTIIIRRQQRLLLFYPKPAPGQWLLQIRKIASGEGGRGRHCCADFVTLGLLPKDART